MNDMKINATKTHHSSYGIITSTKVSNIRILGLFFTFDFPGSEDAQVKGMVISFSKVTRVIPGIDVEGTILERADTIKLLGVQLSNDLSWGHHVEFIVKKAHSRLFCLKMLRRTKMKAKDIIAIFC